MTILGETPGMEFLGAYDRRADLPRMYAGVHFSWAVDFFGNYGNSQWTLPNRLYEGGLHGTIPIAQKSVETGRWLARHGAGILLDDPVEDSAVRFFETLDAATYADAKAAFARVPRSAFVYSDEDGLSFCSMLAGLPKHAGPVSCFVANAQEGSKTNA